jgi:putative hydrolase of the HAD superfamily
MIDIIAFDADDTLWHNETLYLHAQDRFKQLLTGYHKPEWIEQRLDETEIRNISYYGYGIKSFALSMIETAIELTEGGIAGREIQEIVDVAKQMLTAEVDLFEQVEQTLAQLSTKYELMLITKGDSFEQARKVARSGLTRYFKYIEIVADKTPEVYRGLLGKYKLDPTRFLMVGNSIKSDILPVIEMGGQAVYIPYTQTWVHETVSDPGARKSEYIELEYLGQLPAFLEGLNR